MLPQEIIELIMKYQDGCEYSSEINSKIQDIVSCLNILKEKIKTEIFTTLDIDNQEKEDGLLKDYRLLRSYINNIDLLECTQQEEPKEELLQCIEVGYNNFDKKVYPYLVSDDICPFCNIKLSPHIIYYQRKATNGIESYKANWYRCTSCRKMFALDYEVEDFDFSNTNICLNKSKYNKLPDIDIYSLIVLSNTLRCSSNHETKDFVANIPIINEAGEFSYEKINVSFCENCNRFTILKSDFNRIEGVVMAKVIDETSSYQLNIDSDFSYEQSKSELTNYGYNVQTKRNISEQQRHIILSSIIEAQIMTRREVIDHISILIERGSKIPNWKQATQKWKEDREFVANYNSDSLPTVIFDNIILKYKHKEN